MLDNCIYILYITVLLNIYNLLFTSLSYIYIYIYTYLSLSFPASCFRGTDSPQHKLVEISRPEAVKFNNARQREQKHWDIRQANNQAELAASSTPRALSALTTSESRDRPIAYILGEQKFCGHVFQIKEGILIPRRASETLVHRCLHYAQDYLQDIKQKAITNSNNNSGGGGARGLRVLDLGSGSGCLLLSVLLGLAAQSGSVSKHRDAPVASGVGLDLSDVANAVATTNATQLGLYTLSLSLSLSLSLFVWVCVCLVCLRSMFVYSYDSTAHSSVYIAIHVVFINDHHEPYIIHRISKTSCV